MPHTSSRTLAPPSLAILVDRLQYLRRSRLWAQILVAMVLGIAVGLLLAPTGAGLVAESRAQILAGWLALPGHIFLALIQMMVVPLVMGSIILGIASSGNLDYLRKVGFRIAPYFLCTTLVAVCIGVAAATLVRPGQYVNTRSVARERVLLDLEPPSDLRTLDAESVPELIVDLIPTNPTAAVLQRSMLQIVTFSILIGIALISMSLERAAPLVTLTASIQELSMKVVGWAMALAPAAVFGLLAQVSINIGFDAILGIGAYVATVLGGLATLLVFYLAIAWIVGGFAPIPFVRAIRDVQLLAFSTSSSAAVMPLSMKTAHEKLGVSESMSQLVLPLGATVNMDGTALYQVVAALFLTQVYGIELEPSHLMLLIATTVGASIGAPSAPGVGIVILATVLSGIGVPPTGIALIIGVDRILDMSRTAVNVTGDLTACTVLRRWLPEPPSDSATAAPVVGT